MVWFRSRTNLSKALSGEGVKNLSNDLPLRINNRSALRNKTWYYNSYMYRVNMCMLQLEVYTVVSYESCDTNVLCKLSSQGNLGLCNHDFPFNGGKLLYFCCRDNFLQRSWQNCNQLSTHSMNCKKFWLIIATINIRWLAFVVAKRVFLGFNDRDQVPDWQIRKQMTGHHTENHYVWQ